MKTYDSPGKNITYGRAGKSMSSESFRYKDTAKIGARGERILAEKLRGSMRRKGWIHPDIPLFSSLKIPGKYSDVDFAVTNGNKVLLIDAKIFRQDGGFYWNIGNDSTDIFRGFSRYRASKGNKKGAGEVLKLSRNMNMARDIFRKKLPGFTVESIVVVTTDESLRNSKMPNTMFLTYPGGIKTYNDAGAKRFIKKFLGKPNRTENTIRAERVLKKYTQ